MVQKHRQVALRIETWRKAAALRDALSEKLDRRVTLTDTIDRALDCLEDAHRRGAWLSPKEAGPVWEQRLRDQIASVIAQIVARAMPDRILRGIAFHPTERTAVVVIEDPDEQVERVPVLLAPTEAPLN